MNTAKSFQPIMRATHDKVRQVVVYTTPEGKSEPSLYCEQEEFEAPYVAKPKDILKSFQGPKTKVFQ